MSYDIYLNIDTGGKHPVSVYSSNITFNFYKMFSEAFRDQNGLSDSINFLNGMTAAEAIKPLRTAVDRMEKDPDYYRQFDSPNGWGIYDHALLFLEEWLAACIEHPKTIVEVNK